MLYADEGSNQSSRWNSVFDKIGKFNQFMEYTFSLPMLITETIVENIHTLVTQHALTCSICLCLSITTTLSVTSLAVGLGVGLGVGCTRTNIIYTNSTNG